MNHTAKPGVLAYFDSFSGLVPVKITQVWEATTHGRKHLCISTKATANRGPYKRGDTICDATGGIPKIIPRPSVYRSRQHCGQYRIRPFTWTMEG